MGLCRGQNNTRDMQAIYLLRSLSAFAQLETFMEKMIFCAREVCD